MSCPHFRTVKSLTHLDFIQAIIFQVSLSFSIFRVPHVFLCVRRFLCVSVFFASMDNDVVFQSSSSSSGSGVNFKALTPFSAMTHRELAQIIAPTSFPEVEPNSDNGLRWIASNVTTFSDHGNYKLYLCQRRGLAMWVPCGDWFYTNQTPQASQTIAQYAERRSKANRIRQKPYDRPEGSNLSNRIPNIRIPRVRVDALASMPEDGARRSIDIEPDLVQIRAEERRQERQQQQSRAQVNHNLLPLRTPPPPASSSSIADRPSTSAEAGLTSKVGVRKPPSKKKSPSKGARWLAFKEKKKAAKIATFSKSPVVPPRPPSLTSPPEMVRSLVPELQAEAPHTSPQQQQQLHEPGDASVTSDGAQVILPSVLTTANGSSISFDDIQPIDLDGIDLDELMALEDI